MKNSIEKPKKKKSLIKKMIITLGTMIITLILLAIALPYFFKDEIKATILKDINDNINAKVTLDNVDVSLLKSFPNFTASIKNLKIDGLDSFQNQTLFFANETNLVLDISSVIQSSKPIEIVKFSIIKPTINILINKSGEAKYNIIKESNQSESTGKSSLRDIKLKYYSIADAKITYENQQSHNQIHINNLNHSGKGDFKDILFTLQTNTTIDEINIKSGNISYLKKAKIKWDINFDADLNNMSFEIAKNSLQINELKLLSQGQIVLKDDFANINLNIEAPGNNFKEIFSIIPNAFIKDYKDVQAQGDFTFKGDINGKYYFNEDNYPSFDFEIKTNNGYIKYPTMPLPIEKMNSNIQISNKGGTLNNTIIDINPLTFSIDNEKMWMKMLLENIIVNPSSKGKINGNINLESFSKAFPIEDLKRLSGRLQAKLDFNFNKSLTNKSLSGNIVTDNINAIYADYPKIQINAANANLSNSYISINQLNMKIGKSDIAGTISIKEPLNYLSKNKEIIISFNGNSSYFDANEWLNNKKSKVDTNTSLKNDYEFNNLLKNRLIVNFDYAVSKLKYEDYDIRNLEITGRYSNDALDINNQNFILSDSKMKIKGRLHQLLSWVLEDKILKGTLDISSPHFNMDKFMGTSIKDANTNNQNKEEAFEIPENMDLTINTNIKRVNYTGKNLKDIRGQLKLNNQTITFDKFEAFGMGGKMFIDGNFSTPKNQKAQYDIRYRMSNMKYEDMYNSVITYKALAPVTKFIRGVFNADFNIKGTIGKDFTPDLNNITATGLIHTLNAYIKNYPGINNITSKLQLQSLKNLKIDDSKNSFEIINGIVTIKPFDVEYKDMKFNISGTNKLDKNINYIIHAKIPKEKIKKIPGGKTLNKGLDYITSKANSLGVNINNGNILNFDFLLTGQYDNPKINIKLTGISGKNTKNALKNKIENEVGNVKKEVKTEINTKKKEIQNKTKEIIDSTKKKVEKKVDNLKDKAKKQLEQEKEKAKKKLKDALNNLNPFKKK